MRLARLLDPAGYFPGLWDLRGDPAARAYWRQIFLTWLEDLQVMLAENRGPGARPAAEAMAAALADFLDRLGPAELERYPHVHAWTLVRDRLLATHGIDDPYREAKEHANRAALLELPQVLARLGRAGPGPEGLRLALANLLAGNRFDLGSPAAVRAHRDRAASFAALAEQALDRPWLRNDLGLLAAALAQPGRIVLLADNAGADFVCGVVPWALWLAEAGHQVWIGANQEPSLNDVTVGEASDLLARAAGIDAGAAAALASGRVQVLSTGGRSPGIDLREVTAELDRAVSGASLLVLEGQGRAIETNWLARLDLPVLRIATLKDPLVAARLGGATWDQVCDWRDAGQPAPRLSAGP